MGKRDLENVGKRAWNILQVALISARKGGVLRRRLVTDLRPVTKFFKSLRQHQHQQQQLGFYGERELSFEKTPLFDFDLKKMNHRRRVSSLRFILPCITPHPSPGSYSFDFDHLLDTNDDDDEHEDYDEEESRDEGSIESDESELGVDIRADKFIAHFYQQMKLQRQISYLDYNN
ncbi:hypothetical protein LINPERHAP2_LOCUS38230 [Linum perenne]